MHMNFLASGMAAVAMLTVASASEPAEARHGGHGMGGGRGWAPHASVHAFAGPGHFAFRHHHRFHHRRLFVGDYAYGYGDDCYWLRRRALYTGSPYWWRRYYACRYGDY
jgi:hypothetical protein